MTEPRDAAWLTKPEVASHYRKPVRTIDRWRDQGIGPRGVKVGKQVLYPRAEIERFDRELLAAATDAA